VDGERTSGLGKRFLYTYLKSQRNLNPANTEELLEDNNWLRIIKFCDIRDVEG
jgi:hypothetical protein